MRSIVHETPEVCGDFPQSFQHAPTDGEPAHPGAVERRRKGNTRRQTFAGIALAVASGAGGSVIAACAPRGSGEGEPLSQQPPRSVPVAVWARGATDKVVFDQITPLVEQRYPHLAITTEPVAGIHEKIVVALAGGGAPELAVINMPSGVPLIGQQSFHGLQRYLARDRAVEQELKSFAPPALQAYRVKGELFAIPVTNETIVLWYNEDLLRQANLVPPHEIENDPQKWNWNTLLEYARKLNRGREQDRDLFGLYIGAGIQASWGNLVYSNGGRILAEDGSKMLLSQAAPADAVQWAVDTIWKADVGPQPATLRTTPHRTLFTGGKLAMVMDGEFFRRNLFGAQAPQGVPFKFNLAQMPFAPRTNKRANVFHTLALPILRGSKSPDAAWQYLKVFVTKDAQQFITDGWGSRGGNEKTYESWLQRNAGGGPPANYAAIVKSDSHGIPYPASPYLGANETFEPLNRIMPQIFDNAVAVRTGLQQMDQETNARLEPAFRAASGGR
jgi:multiple sugar transport system substrate-binding protein